jgi:hypothetical protein
MDSEDRSGHRACVRHLVCSLPRTLVNDESDRSHLARYPRQQDQRETKDVKMTDAPEVSISSKDKRMMVEIDRLR